MWDFSLKIKTSKKTNKNGKQPDKNIYFVLVWVFIKEKCAS